MDKLISPELFNKLIDYITKNLGLKFSGGKENDLERGIKHIAKELNFSDLNACINWFLNSKVDLKQIDILAKHLTIGETYFFRDPQYFEIFEKSLLPMTILLRAKDQRQLRIWCAGCSTGEEVYSIAISLNRIIKDIKLWNITLLASDINTRSLAELNKGVYRDWSFRNVASDIKEIYFDKDNENNYCIKPYIKAMVTPAYLNLALDQYPSMSNNTNAMDIIFCRNVLMYFSPEQAKKVVASLMHCLVPDGYLLVSPCECGQPYYKNLKALNISGLTFYQKKQYMETTNKSLENNTTPAIKVKFPKTNIKKFNQALMVERKGSVEDVYKMALDCYQKRLYEKVIQLLSNNRYMNNEKIEATELLIRSYANMGQLDMAKDICSKAIQLAKVNVTLYYLYGLILEELGNFSEAFATFKQTIYLDHNFILAHFNLGQIALHIGHLKEANKYFSNAKLLASHLKAGEVVPESEGVTNESLIETIEFLQEQIRERAE